MLKKIWSKKNTLPFMSQKKANIIQNRRKRKNYASEETLVPQIHRSSRKSRRNKKVNTSTYTYKTSSNGQCVHKEYFTSLRIKEIQINYSEVSPHPSKNSYYQKTKAAGCMEENLHTIRDIMY